MRTRESRGVIRNYMVPQSFGFSFVPPVLVKYGDGNYLFTVDHVQVIELLDVLGMWADCIYIELFYVTFAHCIFGFIVL